MVVSAKSHALVIPEVQTGWVEGTEQ